MSKSEQTYRFHWGTVPLLVSMPHVGTYLPQDIAGRMTQEALRVPDTDWHLEALYDFLESLGASVLVATHSRYVVDLNRPADNQNLYPGQDTTGLCPIDTFHRDPVYLDGKLPDENEISARVADYWQPYHDQLAAELARIKQEHGVALLWDAHSIRSVVPRFFEGKLPDLNIGTAGGASCDSGLAKCVHDVALASSQYTSAINGRFKGGFITRNYGDPQSNIHAIQLELSQATYMSEPYPYQFDSVLAQQVRPTLRAFLERMIDWSSAAGSQ